MAQISSRLVITGHDEVLGSSPGKYEYKEGYTGADNKETE